MYAIICKKDGDSKKAIPIVTEGDDGLMATWDTLEDARRFAVDNILCQISEVFFVDLENAEIEF